MRLNFVWELKVNELDARFIVDMVIALAALLIGIFFDPIVSSAPITRHFAVLHHQGIGSAQVLWCAFWGLYIVWTAWQIMRWGEK